MIYSKCKFCDGKIKLINKSQGLVECVKCSLIFSKAIFNQEEFEKIYHKLYNSENPKYKLHSIVEYEQLKQGVIKLGYNRKRLIKKYLNKESSILEIGSGIGLTGFYIKKNYNDCYYQGIEIDTEVNEKARSLGLNVKQGDFSIIASLKRKFDIVILWEVLEHIQDIKKCLDLIKDQLREGGLIIFSVPNYDKRNNYLNPGEKLFQDGPPIHLNFFRSKSVEKMFNINGYRVEKLRKKRLPYFSWSSIKKMLPKILTGRYEGSTLYCVIKKV